MKVVIGDLIELAKEGRFDVVVHGCNCFCVMGAGIALSIKRWFPQAYIADFKTMEGDEKKLGTYSSTYDRKYKVTVVNAYTQYYYGGRHVKYDAVRSVFKKIKSDFSGKRIGYPKIGAGLGGGNWEVISKIIDEELEGEDHALVKLK